MKFKNLSKKKKEYNFFIINKNNKYSSHLYKIKIRKKI